nr:ribonuclease H-like domain-containing protein [Tanacetum cinerariifolium]
MVAASTVPMLKLGEFEIWRMRIEQYIQMIDYELWEVIENGETLPKTQVVESVMIEMPITSAEEKAQRRLEVKTRSTLMIGIPNEHRLKFNSIKNAKKLLEAVEKRFVNTVHGVFTASTQVNATFSTNINNLSDAIICSFFASQPNSPQLVHEDFEQIHPDDMEEMDLRWQMAMLTMRARNDRADEGPNYAVMAFSSLSFDSKVSDDEEEDVSQPKIEKKTVRPSIAKMEFVKSRQQEKTVKQAEAVNIACYVQNIVLVVKPHNKTLYELFHGRTPTLSFMKPFGCPVTILNTIDHLAKFDGKTHEGFFVRYSLNSKAFRVFNNRTKIVEENLHIRFSESLPNIVGSGPDWLFDIDAITRIMNYEPIVAGTQSNVLQVQKQVIMKVKLERRQNLSKIIFFYHYGLLIYHFPKIQGVLMMMNANLQVMMEKRLMKIKENKHNDHEKEDNVNSTNNVNTVSLTVNTAGTNEDNELLFDPNVTALEDVSIFKFSNDDEDDGAIADMNNLDTTIKIEEEVYVCQPPGFKDPDFPNRVYKELCNAFEKLMHENFQMSSMGELTFFLGLQVNQKKDGIFISQDKTVAKFLKKIGFTEIKTASTPMETQKPLLKDEGGKEVDVHMYRSMIGSLMYLTSSRLDIIFVVYPYARYQVNPKVSHLYAVKGFLDSMMRNLDNVSGKFLMYLRFVQVFLDNHVDEMSNHERKYISTSHTKKIFRNIRRVGKGFSGRVTPLFPTMAIQFELGEGSAMPTDPHHAPTILQSSSSQPQKTHKPRKPTRKVTQVPRPSDPMEHVADEAIHKELGDSLVRAAVTASSLEAEQDNGNINKTQSKATPNESSSQRTDSGGGPRRQETIRDTTAQTRVLELEKTKTFQHNEITSLKRRVKKLKKRNRSRTYKLKRLDKVGLTSRVESSGDEESLGEDASKQGRIEAIDAFDNITLFNDQDDVDNEMFDVNELGGEEDKGKGIMVEEPVKPKKKDQIKLNEEAAKRLQAEFDKEERLAKKKAIKEQEANIALIKTWDDIQAKIDADRQLAERLKVQEQEELSIKEKSTLFQQLLEKRRKHFAAKRAEKKRSKPQTQAQKRKIMYPQRRKKGYYEIVRGDGKSQLYMFFSQMLKSFVREDLEDLYKLVKSRYGSTRPVENMDYLSRSYTNSMFEPYVEDEVWKRQKGYKVLEWKLYDSCGVHSLRMQSMQIYMLVERKYPLTPPRLLMMLDKKLQIDPESEMAYQLCKLIIKQLKK